MSQPDKRLSVQAYDAIAEALSSYYWYKRDYWRMLLSLFAESTELLAGLDVTLSTKREVSSEVVSRLQADESRYQDLTVRVMLELAGFDETFKALARLENGSEMVEVARCARTELRRIASTHRGLLDDLEVRASERRAEALQSQAAWKEALQLDQLKADFYALSEMENPNARGLAFEPFLAKLFTAFDLHPRKAFALAGEQIDGAFTFDTDDYVLEARWRRGASDPNQVRTFSSKVGEKSHLTMGLMISINGFTSEAVALLKRNGTRVILFDGADLSAVLEGAVRLEELLLRKRRYAAETGDPYIGASQLLSF